MGPQTPTGAPDADASWFVGLFVAHHDDLLRFALRRVERESAADVVAETFTVAWRRRGDVPAVSARLWLFRVAAFVVANQARADSRRDKLHQRVGANVARPLVAADSTDAVIDRIDVQSALERLPENQQEILRLIEWDSLTISEAAVITNCSPATFRVRLHRARRHLATELAVVEEPGRGMPQSRNVAGEVAE